LRKFAKENLMIKGKKNKQFLIFNFFVEKERLKKLEEERIKKLEEERKNNKENNNNNNKEIDNEIHDEESEINFEVKKQEEDFYKDEGNSFDMPKEKKNFASKKRLSRIDKDSTNNKNIIGGN